MVGVLRVLTVLILLALPGLAAAQDYTRIATDIPDACGGYDRYFERQESFSLTSAALRRMGTEGYGRDIALVVGIHDYDDSAFDTLPSYDDPRRVVDFLMNEAGFERVHLLTQRCVTKARLDEIMVDELARDLQPNDRFFFYWQGHGVTEEAGTGLTIGHLPLATSEDGRYASMVEMDDIAGWDRRIPAFQTLYVLDSCFSGLAGVTAQSGPATDMTLDMVMGPSRHLFVAGEKGQRTFVLDEEGTSVFTKALLTTLRTGGPTNSDDGVIRLSELKLSVQDQVFAEASQYGFRITPKVNTLRAPGSFAGQETGEFFFLTPQTLERTDPTIYARVRSGDGITMMSRAAPMVDVVQPDPTPDPVTPVVQTVPTTVTGMIEALQTELTRHNCRPGAIDGSYGTLTARATDLYNTVKPGTCGRLTRLPAIGRADPDSRSWINDAAANLSVLHRCDAPACGTPPGTSYLRDLAQGCWYLAGHSTVLPDEGAIWSGACDADGFITGIGRLTFLYASPPAANFWASYIGETEKGLFAGRGRLTTIDGRVVDGVFAASRRVD